MRTSIIVAAHNEGDLLWQTIRACAESCAGLDHEIVIADDASFDGSVERTTQRFLQVRLVRHNERQGASPTKALGAQHARGEVLVFLDGHCNPEPGAIERLVDDVDELKGEAVVTPAIPSLCTQRWRNLPEQVGHGYRLGLETFDCGWLPLDALRPASRGPRRLFESPALIGCAFAVSRELYDKLWGFDRHMFAWGVEDLDFGLKCWLMGHPILHDPSAVIGHRFRKSFDNYDVPIERLVVNQLRMARKQFAPGVWSDWLDRCRQRHLGRLAGHPEGLWARAWTLFEEHRASAEQERAYLQARRVRDEFWYAERFGLAWPRLQSSATSVPTPPQSAPPQSALPHAKSLQFELSPSPSPPPCKTTGITPSSATVCAGKTTTFAAKGDSLGEVKWSAPGGTPDKGTGASFTTKWDTPGDKTVTASCGGTSATADVTVVKITFDADPVRTGFTIPAPASTIEVSSFCTCDPPAKVDDVTLEVGGVNRVAVEITGRNTTTGRLDFRVKGKSATPITKPMGDTTIGAKIGSHVCTTIQAIVLVPKRIHEPHPQANGNVDPQNLVLDGATSPAAWGLAAGMVRLSTVWIHWLTIAVQDQFGTVLDGLYEGAEVEEFALGQWRAINQALTEFGDYRDPVFPASPPPPPAPATVPAGSPAAVAWPTSPPSPMAAGETRQLIRVKVGGHEINRIDRTVIATPPNHVQIVWP